MTNVTLIGNITKDAEPKQIQSGMTVIRLSVAVNRKVNKEQVADFFNVIVWGKLAESLAPFLKKSKKIAVVGELRNNTFENNKGEKITNTEIHAVGVELLSPRNPYEHVAKPSIDAEYEEIDPNGDLPF